MQRAETMTIAVRRLLPLNLIAITLKLFSCHFDRFRLIYANLNGYARLCRALIS